MSLKVSTREEQELEAVQETARVKHMINRTVSKEMQDTQGSQNTSGTLTQSRSCKESSCPQHPLANSEQPSHSEQQEHGPLHSCCPGHCNPAATPTVNSAHAGVAGLDFPGELNHSFPVSTPSAWPKSVPLHLRARAQQADLSRGSQLHAFKAAKPASWPYLIDLPPLC